MKHTPGPWKFTDTPETEHHLIDGNGTHKVPVAVIERQDDNNSKANAHLIAAAPELLEALEWGMKHVLAPAQKLPGTSKYYFNMYDKACAAIAKAKGEAS